MHTMTQIATWNSTPVVNLEQPSEHCRRKRRTTQDLKNNIGYNTVTHRNKCKATKENDTAAKNATNKR